MANDIYQAAAIGIIAVILIMTIKKDAPAFAVLITIAASALIFIFILPRLTSAVQLINETAETVKGGGAYIGLVVRIIGIAYVSEFGAQICADAGETAIASKVELAGKVLIMTVSAPVVVALLDTVLNIL